MLAIGTGGCSLETDVNCAGCGARLIVWLSQALGCNQGTHPSCEPNTNNRMRSYVDETRDLTICIAIMDV